ncbi:hypothetical protein [Phormidium tenue]|uniref:Uncharacterized protein n=1 Tax=Phormidium tenue NIES-30 TaxID=549789 RepID=A0A1U7J8W3_9CYAN|nr:hypothetical protein [Phormidium tenue]MBD2231116.1 hypothetical protein [Phormidium tenue FACHB-1052]OKH49859.1 hypothetical protein NIES30_03855 [Phormidium tenue NIES-30]
MAAGQPLGMLPLGMKALNRDRLHGLPLHRAVPAQISVLLILIWHHPVAGHPALELNFAMAQSEKFCRLIRSFIDGSVALTTAHT